MQEVVDGSDTFTYHYVNDSDLLQSVTGPVMNTTYSYETNRDVKTVVDNAVSGSTVSKYSYDYDALGRRENRVQEGSAFAQDSFDDFEYNPRSEVTGSERFAGTNSADQTNPLTGLDYAFQYDNIGNRISFTENSDLTEYVANELNQYSQIDDGSTLEPTHDADGNLTFDGQFNYSWNGENRLVQVTSAVVTDGAKRLTFWYDHQGRRFQKRVEEYQSGAWNEIELTRFLYDSWNLIAEYDATNGSNDLDKTYTWGLDLSLTPQGAGGVGGLLSMTDEANSQTYFYAFDANGNVTELVDEQGDLSAHYEYSPFGQLTTATGPMADANPFRFSTKYQDQATGLLYYGFRYYDPETGRWPSRDPIGEQGGFNVYGFVGNNGVSASDYLGLVTGVDGEDYISCGSVTRGSRIDSKFKHHPIVTNREKEFLRSGTRDIDGMPHPVHYFLMKYVKRRWLEDWTLWRVFQYCVKECENGSFDTVRVEGTDLEDDSGWIILDRWEDQDWRGVAPGTPDPK